MMKKVGIPRALFYFKYFPLWESFFKELEVEVVVSSKTTKKILNDGTKLCVDEACMPVKVFYGHVLDLKGKVDYLFIPRLTSISQDEYICPKFGGLPDMIRNTFINLPTIIDTEINIRKSRRNLVKSVIEVGKYFTNDVGKIKRAFKVALKSYEQYKSSIRDGLNPDDLIEKKLSVINKKSKEGLNIAVIGHVYNIYDKYINMNLIEKLKKNNVKITTVDMIEESIINDKSRGLNKKMFWYFGKKAIGGSLHLIDRKDIDGIIYIMTFGCGIDAFVCDLVERRIRQNSDIPFTVITLDEHSGEAGLDTRVEAFIDMIRWRNKDEVDLPSYG